MDAHSHCGHVISKAPDIRQYSASAIPARESLSVMILGHWSPTSQMGGRVISAEGLAPTVMAGTHGYGFGMVMVYEGDSD